MNGLLTVYQQKESSTSILKHLLIKGLDALSHRGGKSRAFFFMNRHLQKATHPEDVAQLAMGTCSSQNDASPIASRNGDMLFFEGRLLNKKYLCQSLSDTDEHEASDAEIVLRMLKQHGVNCFSSLKGFWSLIYLDSENKTLYGARDHFGNRPLWFCHTDNHFALASEGRTIYSLFDDVRSMNRNTVIDFLLWGNIGMFDQYFFDGIHSVEPSHYVRYEIETNRLSVERYYTLPYNRSKTSYHAASEKIHAEKLRTLIADSVHQNLSLFEGPLAIGVSGGMDSSTLLCMSRQTDPSKTLVAYTTTDDDAGGEACWAEKLVRHTGVEWIKVGCTANDIIEKLDSVNGAHSAPAYNPSTITQYRIMEEIGRQGQCVFIDGQGGDEMLGGYPAYYPLFLQSLRRNGEWGKWWNELMQVGNTGLTSREMLVRRLKLSAKWLYYTQQKIAQKKRKHSYESLMPDVRDHYFAHPLPVLTIRKEVLNDALFESYTVFLGNILRWGEHSASSQGIECVMPLSDHPDLTEFVFSIPSAFKIHDGWNKYLLRKAMEGIVPDEICRRRQKMGFYYPEQKWLNEIGKPMIDRLRNMEDPDGCINKKYILENINTLYTSANPLYQQFIFRCYSYLLWRNGLMKA